MNTIKLVFARAAIAVGAMSLVACASGGAGGPARPHYKVGAPYKIDGRWYHPREDANYDRRGVSSWYGKQFHGKRTANGEIFDRHLLSAAHKTLPLPSIVQVDNLENGRSIIVRVNDRGPFVDDRIIDLSEAAARELGFRNKGLAKVRVRYRGRAKLADRAPKNKRESRRLARVIDQAPRAAAREAVATAQDALKPTLAVASGAPVAPQIDNARFDLSARDAADVGESAMQSGTFWLAINGFHSLEAAQEASVDLADLGAAQIESAERAGVLAHVVLFGPYADTVTAEAWLAAVIDAGYRGAEILAREPSARRSEVDQSDRVNRVQ